MMDPDLGDDFDADGHLTPAPRPPAVAARAVLPPELTLAAWTERTGIPSDALKELHLTCEASRLVLAIEGVVR